MTPKNLPFFLELPHADVQLDLATLLENGAGGNDSERNADIRPNDSATTAITNRQPFLLHPRPVNSLQDDIWGGVMLDPTQRGGSRGRMVDFTTGFVASRQQDGGGEDGSGTPCTGSNLTYRTAPRDLPTPSTPMEDGCEMLVHQDENMDAMSDPTSPPRFLDERSFSTPTVTDSSFNQMAMAQYSPSAILHYTPTTMHKVNQRATMARCPFTADPGPIFSRSNHLLSDDVDEIALATAFSTPLPHSLTLKPRPRNVIHENGGNGICYTEILRPGIGPTGEGPGAGGVIWLDSRMVGHNTNSDSTTLSSLWNLEVTGTSTPTKMTTPEDPEELTEDYNTITAGRTIGGNQNPACLEHLFPPL